MNTRNCPSCYKKLIYTHPVSYKFALKTNPICRSCKAKINSNKPERKQQLIIAAKKGAEKKSMSGKTFYEVWEEKYGKTQADLKMQEWKNNLTNYDGSNFKLSGLTLQNYWIKKYGEEIAEEKIKQWKKKLSIKSSGINNPMYGKPSPAGSGNGWSGWYKGWFFRSLKELSFMINYIERFNFNWIPGEKKQFKITYFDWTGKKRNYFPDFVLNNKYIIECKPKKLHNSTSVKLKTDAALEFCKLHNYIYKLISPEIISMKLLIKLYESNIVKFLPKYEIKFQSYIKLSK